MPWSGVNNTLRQAYVMALSDEGRRKILASVQSLSWQMCGCRGTRFGWEWHCCKMHVAVVIVISRGSEVRSSEVCVFGRNKIGVGM
jgi:hypothetical protein